VCGSMLLAASSTVLAKEPTAKVVYCTQEANGEWSLLQFRPLIEVLGVRFYGDDVQGKGVARS